jgi:hypothetical protein
VEFSREITLQVIINAMYLVPDRECNYLVEDSELGKNVAFHRNNISPEPER